LFFFLSCEEKRKYEIRSIEAIQVLTELSDSSFLKTVEHINYHENFIYVSDSYNGRVLKLDKDLNLVLSIGQNGEGPEDFLGVRCSAVYDDTLYVASPGNLKMVRFTTNGEFIDTYKLQNYNMIFNYFCINKGGLYFNSALDSLPFVKFDRFMNRQFAFGDWIVPVNEERKVASNNFHVLSFQGKVLTVQVEEPLINLYEEDGALLLSKYIDAEVFKSRLNFKKNQLENPSAQKAIYMLFYSVTSYENKLYLLYVDHNKDNNIPQCDKVVELLYENNDFKINNIYQLQSESGWYSSICCVGNKLICFDEMKSEFQVYNLND